MCDVFFKEHGIDIQHDQIAMRRIRDEAERVKKSQQYSADNILLPFLYADEVSSKISGFTQPHPARNNDG